MSDKYEREFVELEDVEVNDEVYDDEELDKVLDEIERIKQEISQFPESKYVGEDLSYVERASTPSYEQGNANFAEQNNETTIESLVYAVNELIRKTKESERRLLDEIKAVKGNAYRSGTGGDFGATLNSIKATVKNLEEIVLNFNGAVENVAGNLPGVPVTLSADTELMRQLYEIKVLLGSSSPTFSKQSGEMLELYNSFAKLKYTVSNKDSTFSEKYNAVDDLVKKLDESKEYDIFPVVAGVNAIIDELGGMTLDEEIANDAFDYLQQHDGFSVSNSRKEAIRSYLSKISNLLRDGVADSVDALPDIIAVKNGLQNNRNEFECESIYSSVLNINITLLSEKDPNKIKELKDEYVKLVKRLTVLEVRDLIKYPRVEISRPYKEYKLPVSEGVYSKLGEVKDYLLDNGVKRVCTPSAENEGVSEPVLLDTGDLTISHVIVQVKNDCTAILNRLNEGGYSGGNGISFDETVSQLDRLFEDVKNLAVDCENTVMGAIEVLSDAIASVIHVQEESRVDRSKLINDVAFIRSSIENGYEPSYSVPSGQFSSVPKSDLSARLDAIEKNQQEILATLSALAISRTENVEGRIAVIEEKINATVDRVESNVKAITAKFDSIVAFLSESSVSDSARVIEEIKLLREQLFAVSMVNVAEGDDERYDSYHNVILSELYALGSDIDALLAPSGDKTEVSNAEVLSEIKKLKRAIAKHVPIDDATKKTKNTTKAKKE